MPCSSDSALTGDTGKFVVDGQLIARTTSWNVNPKLATKSEWGDSDSQGYTNRVKGRKDCTFGADGKYDTDDEVFDVFMPGDHPAAYLWMDNVSLYWAFPCALCEDFSLMLNMDTQEVVGWTSAWGADGIFYHPGAAGAPAAVLP